MTAQTNNPLCQHCGDEVPEYVWQGHWPEGLGHEGLCCDCMDLSCGMDLGMLNVERMRAGKDPITKPWPGRDESGRKITD